MGRLRTALPRPIGTTAAFGESDLPARADHVHAIDAASLATALQEAVNRVTGGSGITLGQAQALVSAAVASEAGLRLSADTSLSTALADEVVARQAADADLDARKVDIGTGIDAQRLLVGEDTTTAGGDANLTWDGTTLQVEGTVEVDALRLEGGGGTGSAPLVVDNAGNVSRPTNITWDNGTATLNLDGTLDVDTVRVDGMTGTGDRMVVAGADGTQADVDQVVWTGTLLSVTGGLKASDQAGTGTRLVTAAADGTQAAQAALTWNAATLGVAGALQSSAMTGTGERVVVADTNGNLYDADEMLWQSSVSYKRLAVEWGGNGFVGTNTIHTGSGSDAVAAHQTVGSGAFGIQASWCSGSGQTVGGLSAANSVGFIAYGTNSVFYGSHASGESAVVRFVYNTGISARFDVNGWWFANQIQVNADAGATVRGLFAQTDGHHAPNADVTATGSGATAKMAINSRTVGVRYRHAQGSASATWVIAHNLDEYPSVTVVDSSGNVCLGDVKYDSTNQITLTFGAAFAGNAYLN